MKLREIPLKEIEFDTNQPRKEIREDSLAALSRSLEEIGQIQPIIVRPREGKYILIAGERRVRALREKQKESVWALVFSKKMDPERWRLIQLAENLQRENLNPLERAQAINRYIEEEGLSKKEASRRLGIPRTTINDWLNILDVGEFYQKKVLENFYGGNSNILDVGEFYQKKVLENFYGGNSALTLSHLSLAKALDASTDDPTKKKRLLDQVLKFNLSRVETRRIVEICKKNPIISLEEVVAGILINREQKKVEREQEEKSQKEPGFKDLEAAFGRLEGILTRIMDGKHEILQEKKEEIIAEFNYLEQLLEQAIPGGVSRKKKVSK